jgi:hypothetical protein
MSFNPLLIALPIGAYFLLKKPEKTVKKSTKPVDNKPVESKTGFTLNECNEIIITNEDQFQEYNKNLLDTLISDKSYSNALNTSAMKFAKAYLQKLLPTCANKEITTPNQFLIIYAVLSKGLNFFLVNRFLIADRWKKYFSNDVEFELYMNSQEADFVYWAESVETKDFDHDALELLEKSFDVQEIPTIDRGFQYDCSSIKVTNNILMLSYFEKLAAIVAKTEKEFENPSLIELRPFAETMLSIVNPECFDKFKKGEMGDHDLVIVLKLFDLFIQAYMNALIGIKEEIELYKVNNANGQWALILQDFNIPAAAIQEFDEFIKEKGMYP